MSYGFSVYSADGKLQMSSTGLAYKIQAEYSFYVPPFSSWTITPGTNSAYRHYSVVISAPEIVNVDDWEVIWIPKVLYTNYYFAAWAWSVTMTPGNINIRVASGYNYTQKLYLVKKT